MVNARHSRLVVSGTHSGVGKTSVALALAAALSRRGLKVRPFKVGPDYLDPTYLERASGSTCYNLDGWMLGEAYVRALFDRAGGNADLALIEGVMGLFDGADPAGSAGSTAEIARWLDAPVLLVVDAQGAARSLAALVRGFASFDPRIRLAGVIANRVGSERHSRVLDESFRAERLPPLLGAIPRGAFPELPRRHLGLVTADPQSLPRTTLDALADALERYVDLPRLLCLTGHDRKRPNRPDYRPASGTRPRVSVGIAWDEAFHFYYPDNLEALEAAGCCLVRFSPLRDRKLPLDLHGLYLGGGYPESHARQLAENRGMRASIRAFAACGRPLYAECGGLIYLSQNLFTLDGESHPMLGILPGSTRMRDRRKHLRYVELTLLADSVFGSRGDRFRGHEYHYSELTDDPAAADGWRNVYRVAPASKSGPTAVGPREASPPFTDLESGGFQRENILASYVHTHFASRPDAAMRFARRCETSGAHLENREMNHAE